MKRHTIAIISLLTASLTVLSGCGTSDVETKAVYEIGEAQSYEVDAVSGATVTSNAIKDAVARCLEKASE